MQERRKLTPAEGEAAIETVNDAKAKCVRALRWAGGNGGVDLTRAIFAINDACDGAARLIRSNTEKETEL